MNKADRKLLSRGVKLRRRDELVHDRNSRGRCCAAAICSIAKSEADNGGGVLVGCRNYISELHVGGLYARQTRDVDSGGCIRVITRFEDAESDGTFDAAEGRAGIVEISTRSGCGYGQSTGSRCFVNLSRSTI